MAIDIDKEYRIRGDRSAKASKSSFAHKVKQSIARTKKSAVSKAGSSAVKGTSREVMVKITGSGKTARGIKNSINYISRESDLKLQDDQGEFYDGNDSITDTYDYMTDPEDRERLDEDKNINITHNMVFSAPSLAGVPAEVMQETVREVLKEKFPNNRFLTAFHNDTDNPHVHALLRIPDATGKRINIRKQDLRDLRTGIAHKLQGKGYNVKATHKRDFALKHDLSKEPNRTRNLYEVVNFGRTHFNHDPKNKRQHFIELKTISGGKTVTIWGTNLPQEILREKVLTGSVIKMKKEGETLVKVPVYDKDKNISGYKETKRNNWKIENQGTIGIDRNVVFNKVEIKSDAGKVLEQLANKRSFDEGKSLLLKPKETRKEGVRFGLFKF